MFLSSMDHFFHEVLSCLPVFKDTFSGFRFTSSFPDRLYIVFYFMFVLLGSHLLTVGLFISRVLICVARILRPMYVLYYNTLASLLPSSLANAQASSLHQDTGWVSNICPCLSSPDRLQGCLRSVQLRLRPHSAIDSSHIFPLTPPTYLVRFLPQITLDSSHTHSHTFPHYLMRLRRHSRIYTPIVPHRTPPTYPHRLLPRSHPVSAHIAP